MLINQTYIYIYLNVTLMHNNCTYLSSKCTYIQFLNLPISIFFFKKSIIIIIENRNKVSKIALNQLG